VGTQSDAGWKDAAKKNWLAIGLPEFLASIGLDFDKHFIEAVNKSNLSGDGEIHHQILSNKKFEGATGIWVPQPGDEDHPVAILDFSWHYEISEDLRPLKYI
jgi:hypothetical protein